MADVKWIKITADIFSDEKILLIEALPDKDAILVIWFKLITMAGRENNGGVFLMNNGKIPYTDEMLSAIFHRPLNTVRLALATFEQYGMIEIIDNVITLPTWEKHQNVEGMDKIREQNRIRKQNQRARERELLESHVTSRDSHAIEEDKDKEKEKNKNIDKDKDNRAKTPRFVPPTIDEVRDYCNERGNSIDPEAFIDYYSSQKWKKANGRALEDWKAAVRTWEKKDYNKPKAPTTYDWENL